MAHPKKTPPALRFFIRSSAALGYFVLFLSWMWAALLWLPLLLNESFTEFIIPNNDQPTIPQQSLSIEPSLTPLFAIIAIAITVIIIVVSIIVIVRLPKAIVSTTRKATHSAARAATPLVVRTKKIPTKERKKLNDRMIALIKVALLIAPVILCLLVPLQSDQKLDQTIVMLFAFTLFITSVLFFTIEYVLYAVKTAFDKRKAAS